METCRACLSTDKDLFQVDEQFISSYNLLTNLNVKPYDSMPKRFCRACMESVTFYVAFRNKCISSESTLQQKSVNYKVDEFAVEIAIKREIDVSLDENWQGELEDFSVKDKIKKEECVGLCDESFVILDDLNKHLDDHKTDECCGICSKTFENWPKLLAHRAIHSSRKYCHLCPRRFHAIFTLEQHYLHVHFKEKLKEMSCDHCQKTYTCPEKFGKHMETHNVECDVCSEVFLSRRLLLAHMRTHDPEKRYECDQCEYTAIYADVLARHKSRRHKKYSCKTCDRKFAKRSALKIHICKDKSKICPVCGIRIYEAFNRHLKSHQVRIFKCEKCSVSYKTPLSLKVHMDRHDNNPTQECDYCGRKFYYPTTLIKHRRVHTGEKPYPCKICGKRFAGNNNLRVHMKVHGFNVLVVKRNKSPVEVSVVAQATTSA